MKRNLVAIDLAKRVFQVCVFDADGRVTSNRRYSLRGFNLFLLNLAPTIVAMEACASAHYWGRKLIALGHEVRLVPPQHAKAFRRVHKSDHHDAVSIGEACMRPRVQFVPVKSIDQQDLQLLGRVRENLVRQRTMVINQIRGLAREYGVDFPVSRHALLTALPAALEDGANGLSFIARQALADQLDQVRLLQRREAELLLQIEQLARPHPAYERLRTVPGIGPINAAALLAALGSGRQFKSGRHCAAWLGLVPRQRGTGGTVQLGSISKNGDRTLRSLLIHGARAVVRWADRHTHAQSRWILDLVARRGKNKAIVALANKLARIVWAVLTSERGFDATKAFRAQHAR
jgi:transposase